MKNPSRRYGVSLSLLPLMLGLLVFNVRASRGAGGDNGSPWAPWTEGPGAGGSSYDLARTGGAAPGGGFFLPNWGGQPDVLLANRRGEILLGSTVDLDGNGTPDFQALFFGRPNALKRIVRTGDQMPDGSILQSINPIARLMVLTDAGQVYFAAGVPKYVATWPFGGAAHLGLFGWEKGRFFTLVGRGKSQTRDGKYIHLIDRVQLLSPNEVAYEAYLLDADGISRGAKGLFVYVKP